MSNKTLLISIIVILLVFGASIVGYRMYNSHRNAIAAQSAMQNANQQSSISDQSAPIPTSTPSQFAVPTSTPNQATSTSMTDASCVRNFSQDTLTNAKVDIQNREVAIDVKGFGTIQLELYDKDAPKTVENFLRLANAGYYNCLTFHRVAKGFVIQGGDPNGNGTGGTSAFGAPFADELNANTPSYQAGYVKGVLAMANSGPNTNGSQFFIMLADNQLPHNYTIFGKVVAGQSVVDAIGNVAITPVNGPTDGSPVTPVVMESVKIIK